MILFPVGLLLLKHPRKGYIRLSIQACMAIPKHLLVFLFGLSVVLMLSTLVVILLRGFIRNLILDLNGEKDRQARFWVAYSNTLMLLVPLIIALIFVPDGKQEVDPFVMVVNQVKWSLIGLASTVFVLGLAIHQLVPKSSVSPSKNKEEKQQDEAPSGI